MAKLSAHGAELFRYFSLRHRCLMSVASDGVTLRKTPYSGWGVYARKKADVTFDEWLASKEKTVNSLPDWARKCKSIPSMATLERWSNDGVCRTPTGEMVEPDGVGSDGVPSWLVVFGLL